MISVDYVLLYERGVQIVGKELNKFNTDTKPYGLDTE
jgi:hypothetical protein